MQVISLNDGSNVVIGSMYDAAEIIETEISYELANYIKSILWEQNELGEYISDLEAQNMQLKNAMKEYENKDLWNKEYFKYLIEIGKDGMNYGRNQK